MFTIKSSHVPKKFIAGVSTFDILLPTSSKVLKTLLHKMKFLNRSKSLAFCEHFLPLFSEIFFD